jgi:hypothetical protein
MSPVAVEPTQDLPAASQLQKQLEVSSPGPILVIGSPSTAQDGTYPDLISELEKDSADVSGVEKQMVDRILDGGRSSFPPEKRKGRLLIQVSHTQLLP